MERSLAILGVAACLGLAAVGCGSSDSSSSSSTSAGGGSVASGGGATTGAGPSTNGGGSNASTGSSSSGGSSGSGGSSSSGGGKTNANGAPLGSNTSKSGDNSIQTYGSEVQGGDKAAVVSAMRTFLNAIATSNYPKVCAGLTSQNQAALAQFAKVRHMQGKGCAGMLSTLLTSQTSAARKAANGTVTHVRVGGGNAFILFRPAGGGPINYFVMKLENGAWKSTSLATGTPLNPTIPAQ